MYEGIAQWIGANVAGLDYQEGAGGNVFVNRMPSTPDNAVALYTQASVTPDSKLPYDPVEFQIVARGEPDGVWAIATLKAIYDKLQGMRHATLPDGTVVVYVLAQSGSPFSIGDDANGRVQFSQDYMGETYNPTEERP